MRQMLRFSAMAAARYGALAAVAGVAFTMPFPAAHAQNQPVRMIVPMAAGGPADAIARHLAERLRGVLKTTVVIENRAGANGATGAAAVASAEPDGKTLLFATSGLLTITPHLDQKLPFNPATDLTPISRAVVNGSALVVRSSFGPSTMAEFVAYAKQRKDPPGLGSAGVGNITHLYIELLKEATKTDFLHVPYRGVAPAMNDVLAGSIDGLFADLPASLPQIKGGTMKALGLVGETRSKAAPDIPTIAEQGFPGVVGASWFGVFGPAKMDPKLAESLSRQVAEALADPELVAALQAVGAEPAPLSPSEFAALIERDRAHWGRLIRQRNVTLLP